LHFEAADAATRALGSAATSLHHLQLHSAFVDRLDFAGFDETESLRRSNGSAIRAL
jgi:hypothetical protein